MGKMCVTLACARLVFGEEPIGDIQSISYARHNYAAL